MICSSKRAATVSMYVLCYANWAILFGFWIIVRQMVSVSIDGIFMFFLFGQIVLHMEVLRRWRRREIAAEPENSQGSSEPKSE